MKKFLAVLLLLVVVVGVWNATYYWPDRVIKDNEVIAELEASDPSNYEEIKKMFSEEISARTGKCVDKVVFYVAAFHSYFDYTAEVYYQADGEWYFFTADEFSRRITPELDNKLVNLLVG